MNNQTTTGATKIAKGKYLFNGYTIEKVWQTWDINPADGSQLKRRFGMGMFSSKAEAIDTIANNLDMADSYYSA